MTHSHAERRRHRLPLSVGCALAVALPLGFAGCSGEGPSGPRVRSEGAPLRLEADCAASASAVDAEVWFCPASRTVECRQAEAEAVETVYVTPEEGASCETLAPTVDEGPYGPGTYEIVVSDGAIADAAADAGAALCTATLEVVDTLPPEVTSQEVVLWPPNHEMHTVTIDDCLTVHDQCDADLDARFTWATSDEPANGLGDGNHEPDIVFDGCNVSLRAERSGREDGRVYELGYEVVDDAGNVTDGVCRVSVPHDRSSQAMAGEPATRVEAPAMCQPDGPVADAGAPDADAGASDGGG